MEFLLSLNLFAGTALEAMIGMFMKCPAREPSAPLAWLVASCRICCDFVKGLWQAGVRLDWLTVRFSLDGCFDGRKNERFG